MFLPEQFADEDRKLKVCADAKKTFDGLHATRGASEGSNDWRCFTEKQIEKMILAVVLFADEDKKVKVRVDANLLSLVRMPCAEQQWGLGNRLSEKLNLCSLLMLTRR